jgi:hypothetical protein
MGYLNRIIRPGFNRGGVMTMMKVKNNNDDEANATMTITTTPETAMTVCIVDNGNCQIVDCQPYH